MIACLRKGETYAAFAIGLGLGGTTVCRYSREAREVLTVRGLGLSEAIMVAARKSFVIVGGTRRGLDRVGAAWGRPAKHGLIEAAAGAEGRALADGAYRGAGTRVEVSPRRRPRDPGIDERPRLPVNQKAVNSARVRLRGPGERANAQLESWKILRKSRASPPPCDPTGRHRAGPPPRRLNPSGKGSIYCSLTHLRDDLSLIEMIAESDLLSG